MADLFGARLVLLGATDPKDRKPTKLSVEPGAYLHGIALELEGKGLQTVCDVREGRPAAAILEAAKAHEADLIAMATHGRKGLARLVIGSVTEEVLRKAACPMLVRRSVNPDETRRNKLSTDCVGR
jgi:nucleotide-binding universal stress UspA family protein